jgi:hypothetical protein
MRTSVLQRKWLGSLVRSMDCSSDRCYVKYVSDNPHRFEECYVSSSGGDYWDGDYWCVALPLGAASGRDDMCRSCIALQMFVVE